MSINSLGSNLYNLASDISEWSQATFGTDAERGPIGSLRHLAKEALEAAASPTDPTKYADCFILLLEASRRAGMTPLELVWAAQAKMIVNRTRTWPKPIKDEPVEHVR